MTAERIMQPGTGRHRRAGAAAAVAVLLALGTAPNAVAETDPGAPGTVTTVAGGGGGGSVSYGFAGDGGPATQAQLWRPRATAFDAAGNAYIADGLNHRVRKVDPAGTITTLAGNGQAGDGGDGGPATEAQLNNPHGVAADAAGNVYIADSTNHRIRRVDPAGVITTFAGTGMPGADGEGGPAGQAQVKFPRGLAIDGAGNLYIADSGNNRIAKVNGDDATITTVAGQIPAGFAGDGGPATRARLDKPHGVWVTGDGTMYIADSANHRIRVVDAQGSINTLAGSGTAGSEGDGGPATQAQLNEPHDVAVDSAGNVYVAESLGHRIRKVDPSGVITTIGGSGTPAYSGDGGPATQASFDQPRGVTLDPKGHLWVADMANNRIRLISSVSSA